MAGAALQSKRKSMPPHATTLRAYTVMRKPGIVRRPIAKDFFHGSLGGGIYPFAY
jgi:hypothetical protein